MPVPEEIKREDLDRSYRLAMSPPKKSYASPSKSFGASAWRSTQGSSPSKTAFSAASSRPVFSASPTKTFSPLKLEEEDKLIVALREQLSLENDLEQTKIELASKSDFNLLDSFRLFDIDGKGWVTASEVLAGLDELKVQANRDDVYLFVRRWDKDNDGRLRYSDFCDALTPFNSHYAGMLSSRPAYHIHHAWRRGDYFHFETRA
jgi:hypothetical protein